MIQKRVTMDRRLESVVDIKFDGRGVKIVSESGMEFHTSRRDWEKTPTEFRVKKGDTMIMTFEFYSDLPKEEIAG
jgi:hypothetical protein